MSRTVWMPPLVDDSARRQGKPAARRTPAGEDSSADYLSRLVADATAKARPDWVARAPNWRSKTRRWIVRSAWRLLRKALRKAGARRAVLAPFLICAATYFVAAVMSLFDHGAFTMFAAIGTGAPIVYWWAGGPAWRLTRRRGLKPRQYRAWVVSAYLTILLLGVMTAGWRVAAPMPGFWLTAAVTFSIATAWHRRVRTDTVEEDTRHLLWEREKKVKGTVLGDIQDLTDPQRWVADVDLTSTDMLVTDFAKQAPYIARRYGVDRTCVVVDEARPGYDSVARLTVVQNNPLHRDVLFDRTWLQHTTPGCLPLFDYPDAVRGQIRLYTPRSGGVNSLFTGDIGTGKTAAMFTAAIQALSTGRVWLAVADPQDGQSLPPLTGERGIAGLRGVGPAGVFEAVSKIHAGLLARSAYLSSYRWRDETGYLNYGMGFFDQDIMAAQRTDPDTGEHPLHWPLILFILDEAHRAFSDPEYGPQILKMVEDIVKMSRKTGIVVWFATQYPGLEELGNSMVIRQNLVAGNVVCCRNSAGTTGTMILDPSMPYPDRIPRTLPDGSLARGVSVVASAAPGSSRPTFSRIAHIRHPGPWADYAGRRMMPLDEVTAAAMAAVDLDAAEASIAGEVEEFLRTQQTKAKATGPATATPDSPGTAAPAAPSWTSGPVLARCIAYLRHLEETEGYGETTTGLIARATGCELSTVSTTLGRAAGSTKKRQVPLVHKPRQGTWRLGPAPTTDTTRELAHAGT